MKKYIICFFILLLSVQLFSENLISPEVNFGFSGGFNNDESVSSFDVFFGGKVDYTYIFDKGFVLGSSASVSGNTYEIGLKNPITGIAAYFISGSSCDFVIDPIKIGYCFRNSNFYFTAVLLPVIIKKGISNDGVLESAYFTNKLNDIEVNRFGLGLGYEVSFQWKGADSKMLNGFFLKVGFMYKEKLEIEKIKIQDDILLGSNLSLGYKGSFIF